MTEPIYILTAQLDAGSFAWLDGLRRAHFPPTRNVLSAHLTMFHRLSRQQVAALQAMALPRAPIDVTFDAVMFLGFGNAIRAHSPDLERLRADIKAEISDEVSRQDNQRWRPHVTIQNKVTADVARALQAELTRDFRSHAGAITGLQVWHYLDGPWALEQCLPFGQPVPQ